MVEGTEKVWPKRFQISFQIAYPLNILCHILINIHNNVNIINNKSAWTYHDVYNKYQDIYNTTNPINNVLIIVIILIVSIFFFFQDIFSDLSEYLQLSVYT